MAVVTNIRERPPRPKRAVEYQMRSDNHYWVRFKDEWYEVPDEAVVREYGNPTGSGVVWSPKYLVGGRSAASCR
jgi:hypothetical protein